MGAKPLILILTFFICRNHRGIQVVVVLLFIERVIEEIVFVISDLLQEPLLKAAGYIALILLAWLFRHDPKNKKLIPSLLCLCIVSEVVWLLIGYKQTPNIIYYLLVVFQQLAFRFALFAQLPLIERKWPNYGFIYGLDGELFRVYQIGIYVFTLMILEYLLRHILGINALIIYELFPYATQMLLMYSLYLIIRTANTHLSDRTIYA